MLPDRALKKQLRDKYQDEKVFVVPYAAMSHIRDKFTPSDKTIQSLNTYDRLGKYILRADAEYNPTFQQLIPYVLITDRKGEKFYVSKRIGGDSRLLESYSLGFGGHIDAVDGSASVILKGLNRELHEEVDINPVDDSLEFLGHVRDLTSETSDHIGFVFTIKAKRVKIKERDTLKGVWMTKDQLIENYFSFEGWARHIIDYFFETQNALQRASSH